jgi:hypothetical protein
MNTEHEYLGNIEKAIADGHIQQGIDEFISWAKIQDEEAMHKGILLGARLDQLEKEWHAGIITAEEAERRRNRIQYELLHLARALAGHDKAIESGFIVAIKRYAVPVAVLACIAPLLCLGWMWQTKAETIDVKIDITVENMELVAKEDGMFFSGQSVSELQLQHFGNMTIPADSIAIYDLTQAKWREKVPVASALTLQSATDGSIFFEKTRIGTLNFPSSAFISLQAQASNRYNLRFARVAQPSADLYLFDTLLMQTTDNQISGGFVPETNTGEPIDMRIVYAQNPPNVHIAATDLFQVLFKLPSGGNIPITGQPLRIDSARWETVDRAAGVPKQKSTILKGQIEMLSVAKTLTLKKGEILRLKPGKRFFLQELSLEAGAIHAVLNGEVSALQYGLNQEQFSPIMPNRLEKAWRSQKSRLFLILALPALLSLLLLYLKRRYTIAYENSTIHH